MPLKDEKANLTTLNWGAVIKGALLALIIIFLGSVVAGVFYHVTFLSEKTLPLVSTTIFYGSVLACGGYAAWQAGEKGLLHGLLAALLLIGITIIIAKIFSPTSLSFQMLGQKGLLSLFLGALGGILGVGLSR